MLLQFTRPVQGGLRQERHYENTANHLANVDTPGFKKGIISFDKEFRAAQTIDLTQGAVRVTGNDFDLALEDEGFFSIQTPQGQRYTRNGSFTRDATGFLVTQDGNRVLANGAPVNVDGDTFQVMTDGTVLVDGAEEAVLDVVTFGDLTGLMREGRDLYKYEGEGGANILPERVAVRQGALEMSNVESVEEMTGMIATHRMYETMQKMLMTFDDIDGKAVTEVGRPQ